MSSNPNVDGLIGLRSYPDGAKAGWPEPAPAAALPAAQPETSYAPAPAPFAQAGLAEPVAAAQPYAEPHQAWVAPESSRASDRPRARRQWTGAVAVGVVGIIAAGTLGYFLYATTGQRDGALRYAASTQATLTATQGTLGTTQQTLEARNETAAYTRMFVTDSGRVRTDYQRIIACSSFGSCRTAAQSALTDMQAFQADRAAAAAPTALASSDGMLRDALSAAIAADREIISGMDSGNVKKFLDGLHKLNAAMLSMAKAEAALGAELK
jgi:hypothetical protein